MSKKQVIYISGYKRSGKDTFGEMIAKKFISQGKSVKVLSFAGPMKQILAVTLGISEEELDILKNDKTTPHRGYLQRLGTEGMKPVFGEDVWVRLANSTIEESEAEYIILTDFRFPSEFYNCVLQPYVVNVRRDSVIPLEGKESLHISERALDSFSFNLEVTNNSSLQDLELKAADMVANFCN